MSLERKTPLKRTAFRPAEPKPPKGPRKRLCQHCKTPFQPFRALEAWCSPECGAEVAKARLAKQERKSDKARKQALKTRQDWLREAQVAFNAFIRARDHAEPCISCGRFHDGQWHAGHFRSVGAQPALRFDENNVHKQCAPCNNHLSGNVVEYRLRLIQKIGAFAVELLEQEHPPAKYAIEDAQRIKAVYKQKLKELQNVRS